METYHRITKVRVYPKIVGTIMADNNKIEKANEVEIEYNRIILQSLRTGDKQALEKAVFNLMKSFLRGEVRLNFLDFIASNYFDTKVFLDEDNEVILTDASTEEVLSELMGIMNYGQHEAEERVERLIDFMKKRDDVT